MRGSLPPEQRFTALDHAAFTNNSLLSPLRYPGGKRRLLPYIARAIAALPYKPSLLVEPFAGGSSVSVGLLEHGFVQRIGIADADPLVASFWQSVFHPKLAARLAEMTAEVPLTLAYWHCMRAAKPRTVLGRAFQCLYLNRTSFSGILNRTAGPIGGQAQSGPYTVGARFPRERLAKRIMALSLLAPQVSYVRCQDWRTTLASPLDGTSLVQLGRVFYYLDPPFWNKADKLYRHYFNEAEHQALALAISSLQGNWVLSYDMDPSVISLYDQMPGVHHVNMRYTASTRSAPHKSQELLFSNLVVAHGLAKRSLAVVQGGVDSAYINVHAGIPQSNIDKTKQGTKVKAA
jgi:DNA adenine methylase